MISTTLPVFFTALAQLLLLLAVAPLVGGLIRTLKARLQVRRGPDVLQPYRDLYKLFQKGIFFLRGIGLGNFFLCFCSFFCRYGISYFSTTAR